MCRCSLRLKCPAMPLDYHYLAETHSRKKNSKIAQTTCFPSKETQSTTYSLPFKNSCTTNLEIFADEHNNVDVHGREAERPWTSTKRPRRTVRTDERTFDRAGARYNGTDFDTQLMKRIEIKTVTCRSTRHSRCVCPIPSRKPSPRR